MAETSSASFEQVLAEQVTHWQSVLRLQDWNVGVQLVRPHEMRGDNTPLAQTDIYHHRKDAVIRFLHPMDLPTVSHHFLFGEERDYDLNIVHELLHLHFAGFAHASETPEGVAEEQAIEAISRALARLHRESKHAQPVTTPPVVDVDVESKAHGHYV